MNSIYARYRDRAAFLTVYIREAHPTDEWQMTSNETEGVCYRQPRTDEERLAIAKDFIERFGYNVPLVVDRMTNEAEKLYSAWPERFYVLDSGGRIVYKGRKGPFGFHPEEVEEWLTANT